MSEPPICDECWTGKITDVHDDYKKTGIATGHYVYPCEIVIKTVTIERSAFCVTEWCNSSDANKKSR